MCIELFASLFFTVFTQEGKMLIRISLIFIILTIGTCIAQGWFKVKKKIRKIYIFEFKYNYFE